MKKSILKQKIYLCIIFLIQVIANLSYRIDAAEMQFMQGGGYQTGAYDINADQPTAFNWTRQSRFNGPQHPNKLWEFQAGDYIESSPVIGADGTIYFGSGDHKLYALDKNGVKKWEYKLSGPTRSSPAIGNDNTIYICSCLDSDNYSNSGKLYAITSDGYKKWEFSTEFIINSSPAVGLDGTIYITSEDSKLYAINQNGIKKWDFKMSGKSWTSPVIGSDGTIYTCSEDNKLYAITPDGYKKWEFTVVGIQLLTVSPAIGPDNVIYVRASDNSIYAISPEGNEKWKLKLQDGFSAYSSPAIGLNNTIFIGSGKMFYAIDPNGYIKWSFETDSQDISSTAIIGADGTIYFGTGYYDNKIYALNPDGTKKWDIQLNGRTYSSPAIGNDGTIYEGTCYPDNKLYAISDEVPPTVSSNLSEGVYYLPQYVELTLSEPGDIFFSTDGNEPSTNNTKYSQPIFIDKNTILKYFAVDSAGNRSQTYIKQYIIDNSVIQPTSYNWTRQSKFDGPMYPIVSWYFKALEENTGSIGESSPVIGKDGTVYIGANNGILSAVGKDGELKWNYQAKGHISSSSTIGHDGTIYFGTWNGTYPNYTGELYALNENGSLKWVVPFVRGVMSVAPTIGSDGTIYIGVQDQKLYAINPDGTIKWSYRTDERNSVYSAATIGSDGTVYFGSGNLCSISIGDEYKLYALNPNGTLKWSYKYPSLNYEFDSEGSPVLGADGTIYVVAFPRLFAINSDGTLKWVYNLTGSNGAPSIPAISSDGMLYTCAGSGKLYAINSDGTLKWQTVDTGTMLGIPVVGSDNIIYVSGGKNLYAFDSNGQEKWVIKLNEVVSTYSVPAIGSDHTIYINTINKLFCISEDMLPPTVNANVLGGIYNSNQTVSLTLSEAGTIYYTTDGTDPTVNSAKYIMPITIAKSTLLKFIGVDNAGNKSNIYSQTYIIDTAAPTVSTVDPVNNMKNVAIGKTIKLIFSENVEPGNAFGGIVLKDSNITIDAVNNVDGKMLTIDPKLDLKYNTIYTVTIPVGALKDFAGNEIANKYYFSFITEPEHLRITSSNPSQGGILDITGDSTITVVFNKAVSPIWNVYKSKNPRILLRDVLGNEVPISYGVEGNKLLVKPVGNFNFNTQYKLLIPQNAIGGSEKSSLKESYELKFTTCNSSPIITSIDTVVSELSQGDKFSPPAFVRANMSDGSIKEVPVVWNVKTIYTSKVGTFTYEGIVKGYNGKVTLKLTIKVKKIINTPSIPIKRK